MWQFQPKPGHLQSPSGLSVIYEITSSSVRHVSHPGPLASFYRRTQRSGDRSVPSHPSRCFGSPVGALPRHSRSCASGTWTNPGTCQCVRSEEHTSELQSLAYLVCRLLLEKKKNAILVVDI